MAASLSIRDTENMVYMIESHSTFFVGWDFLVTGGARGHVLNCFVQREKGTDSFTKTI